MWIELSAGIVSPSVPTGSIGSSSLVIRDIGSFILGYGTPFKEIKKIKENEKYL